MAEMTDEQMIQASVSSPPIETGAPSVPDSNAASKELSDLEEDSIISDPEKEMTVSNHENESDFDKSEQVHMIKKLLPVLTMMNQEKIIELQIESKKKGISDVEQLVQVARYPQKKECSFCKACIPDFHRRCTSCSYTLCIGCCHDFRDGSLHLRLRNLKATKIIRSKNASNISWGFSLDGSIRCPPKNLGGCAEGILQLSSFYAVYFTNDLEERAKQILCNTSFMKLNMLSDSSQCLLCDENHEAGLYFSTKQKFKDNILEHFMMHWGKGQPVVIRDVFHSQLDLNWDFGVMLCEYLEKSAESRNNTETRSAKGTRDWCEIELKRKQTFSGGITHGNVWNEFLKFKLWFSSSFLQDNFPNHYNAVIQSLPVQEYMNPFTGFLNLGAYSPSETRNPNLGSYVRIYYGGFDNPMDADLLSNLRVHACDMVNILVHASGHPISEKKLNEVKISMNRYNSQDHLKSSNKIANRIKLEAMFTGTSKVNDIHNHEVVLVSDESDSKSYDEEVSQDVDSCGACWDIFRREDVPMLLEYLRKYSDKLSKSYASPKKIVHPLFDEVFYLDDDHKMRLKEEFNVDAFTFKQHIGETVIIPAGCPYQMKKIKSCVNVVYEFMSPESALEGIKVSDEIRRLPVNHKAKGNTVQVKEIVINRMHATIKEMHEVIVSQTEWYWPVVISHLAKPPYSLVFCKRVFKSRSILESLGL